MTDKRFEFTRWKVFFAAFSFYLLVSCVAGSPFEDSAYPYYSLLARAFKQGSLALLEKPFSTRDLIWYRNNFYLYWPPLPAGIHFLTLFFLPFELSDRFETIIFASLNGVLVAELLLLLSRKVIPLDRQKRTLLTLFFLFGTAHFPLAPFGRVWSTSQIYGLFFILCAFISALKYHGLRGYALVGFFAGCSFLCRNTLLVNALWPYYYLTVHTPTLKKKVQGSLLLFLPVAILVGVYLFYNFERFGSLVESGYKYHLMSDIYRPDYERYGAFSIHYVFTNLYYQFLYYPLPIKVDTWMGGSLFLLSPLYAYIFNLRFTDMALLRSQGVLFLSCFISYLPIVLLMGTGFLQFGPRYLLDFSIPLLLLLGIGLSDSKNRNVATILFAISVTHYLIGTLLIGQV